MTKIKTASVCISKSKSEITLFFFHVDTEMTDFFGRFVFIDVCRHLDDLRCCSRTLLFFIQVGSLLINGLFPVR